MSITLKNAYLATKTGHLERAGKPIAIYVDADACPVKVGVADSSSKEFVRFFSYLF